MSPIKAAARTLASNLHGKSISIKHVQALDLLAAGAGLANRHVLATLPALPPIKKVNISLLSSAASVLARHDGVRQQVIVDETSNILKPNPVAGETLIEIVEHAFSIYPNEVANPSGFLDTDRGSAFITELVSEMWFCQYQKDRGDRPLAITTANKLAEQILDVKRSVNDPSWSTPNRIRGAIAEQFNFGYSASGHWWNQTRDEVESTLHQIKDKLEIISEEFSLDIEFDTTEWLDVLGDHVIDELYRTDDSKPTDMLDQYDKCEVLFIFKRDGYLSDEMISSNRRWSDFSDLHIGPELQHPLSSLGYSIADYRRLSGNRGPSHNLKIGLKKRSEPIVTPAELKEIVENACSAYFHFALYAIVPVQDLIDLDLDKPITFSQAAVASYNPISGTFHDVSKKDPITVNPNEGQLVSGSVGYSPEDICCLYHPPYFGSLSNARTSAARKKDPIAA